MQGCLASVRSLEPHRRSGPRLSDTGHTITIVSSLRNSSSFAVHSQNNFWVCAFCPLAGAGAFPDAISRPRPPAQTLSRTGIICSVDPSGPAIPDHCPNTLGLTNGLTLRPPAKPLDHPRGPMGRTLPPTLCTWADRRTAIETPTTHHWIGTGRAKCARDK